MNDICKHCLSAIHKDEHNRWYKASLVSYDYFGDTRNLPVLQPSYGCKAGEHLPTAN